MRMSIVHKCNTIMLVNYLLIISSANRKFDNLMLSANFKISHLLCKGLTDDLVCLKLIILNALFCNFSIFEMDVLLYEIVLLRDHQHGISSFDGNQ